VGFCFAWSVWWCERRADTIQEADGENLSGCVIVNMSSFKSKTMVSIMFLLV